MPRSFSIRGLEPHNVVPAKAGTQFFRTETKSWIPAFAGMTTADE
jgi:hypothetical protein